MTTDVATDPTETESPSDTDAGHRRGRIAPGRVVNGVIALALLLVFALIVWSVRGPGDTGTESAAQTATVDTGEVTATVSANGNVASGQTINADFEGNGGIVRRILVEVGDTVTKGQALARIDRTSARQNLATAQAQLDAAQASYDTTVQGQTSQEQARDQASIRQAEVSLTTARTNLDQARASLSLTTTQQNAAVRRAQQAVADAQDDVDTARQQQQSDPSPEHKAALAEAQAQKSAASSSLASARSSRDSALLQGRQQVQSQQRQVASAEAGLSSTRASVAVNQQPARAGTVASARAQVANAEVSVEQARTALQQTVLRAPARGTVAQVNGSVGQPSTATSSGSSSSGGTTSGTATTSSTGFVTLTDTDKLQVTADVAEADIADVELGQGATLTLSASGQELAGTVTQVDAIETVTNNVVEYGVTVTLDRARGVRLGQSTQVVITTGSKAGVLRVSSSALTTIGDRTTATVQADDGSTSTVVVTTGQVGDGYTEILEGLSEGQTVVLPEQQSATNEFTFPGGGGLGGLR